MLPSDAAVEDLSADRDERLAVLLSRLVEDQQRGRTPDVDGLAREYPDLADELAHLWATVQFAATVGLDATRGASPPASPVFLSDADAEPDSALSLPRDFGDYELLEELGRGGMGVVYKARQKSLNRPVAVKMVRDPQIASTNERARFRGEAEAVARLRHPNIVTVHEVGERDGLAYFCMEFVEGQTLARKLASARGPQPVREAVQLVIDIAGAVTHAHEQGILHRDLKPSNILMDGATPYVSDFGLAKFISQDDGGWRTHSNAIVGTPSYMPPEQAGRRREVGPTCDVYSLGAILYELLTGRPPFQADNPVDTLLLVLEQEPVPPRILNPKVDRDLETVCLKCLRKDPSERYAGAAELAADLRAYQEGQPVSARAGGVGAFFTRLLRETHHAPVLENWGLLWMWHGGMTFLLCMMTQVMFWLGCKHHLTYLTTWSLGLSLWGGYVWHARPRYGPVLFVDRQIAHAWAAGVLAPIALFVVEVAAGMDALALSPALPIAGGMVFVFKAGILSGRFYLSAAALFATAFVMPLVPADVSIALFGFVTALCFYLPGRKYYRQKQRAIARDLQEAR